jgi:hypothetical protein
VTIAPELADKLGKVLAMLTSSHEGERLAAADRFCALLEAHDIHPSQLLANGSAGAVLTEEQMSRIYWEGHRRGVAETEERLRPQRDWTPAVDTRAEVGKDADRLEVILGALELACARNLLTNREIGFLTSVRGRYGQYGERLYVSTKMWAWLDSLETRFHRAGIL